MAVVDHFGEIGSLNKFAQEKGTNLNDHEEEELISEFRIMGNRAISSRFKSAKDQKKSCSSKCP